MRERTIEDILCKRKKNRETEISGKKYYQLINFLADDIIYYKEGNLNDEAIAYCGNQYIVFFTEYQNCYSENFYTIIIKDTDKEGINEYISNHFDINIEDFIY